MAGIQASLGIATLLYYVVCNCRDWKDNGRVIKAGNEEACLRWEGRTKGCGAELVVLLTFQPTPIAATHQAGSLVLMSLYMRLMYLIKYVK
jgi:hypothetical protein